MDALLPSEIARLVLGYLQEQKCEEAAKIFMETSPLLQECRLVAQRGGRYSTKVGGLNLIDILDKYCAANAMVQEKLNKISDNEQLRQCNDLLEQLKHLLEGSRGHRFVVNISVPSQGSPAGMFGTPIVCSSSRKRHHSNSERGKRVAKSLNNLMDSKSTQNPSSQNCDSVEATPLESLPGHKISSKQSDTENNANILNKSISKDIATNTINFDTDIFDTLATTNTHLHPNSNVITNNNYRDQSTETPQKSDLEQAQNKCTAGTNTEEPINHCSTEVHTEPLHFLELDTDDEPHQVQQDVHEEAIENLSIVHTELLQNKELQEQLAENINKTIYENASDTNNISLLTAVKSAVEATSSDPVFDKFLNDLFMVQENDTSPDEESDSRHNQESNSQVDSSNNEPMDFKENNQLLNGSEIPLKQRLRSSSKSQGTDEEEKDTNALLDDQNEEAIRNIVNVIASKRNSLTNSEQGQENIITDSMPENAEDTSLKSNTETNQIIIKKIEPEKNKDSNKIPKSTSKKNPSEKKNSSEKKARKPKAPKQPKTPKPKKQPVELVPPISMPTETETMPTLILCSPDPYEMASLQQDSNQMPVDNLSTSAPDKPVLFLRTVNVPRHLVNPVTLEASKLANPLLLHTALQLQQQASPQKSVNTSQSISNPIVVPAVTDNKSDSTAVTAKTATTLIPSSAPVLSIPQVESITLYGGENSNSEVNVAPIANLPMIGVDESTIDLTVGTGFSPFFKGNVVSDEPTSVVDNFREEPKKNEEQMEVDIQKEIPMMVDEVTVNKEPTPTKMTNSEEKLEKKESIKVSDAIITKNTPKTLLKSRAKNNRLGLSTPRRRNSHVRALDFNTPIKLSDTTKKVPQSCTRSKSVCRSGLFKSPPFSNNTSNINAKTIINTQSVKKIKTVSPIKQAYLRVPIATRSPAPKLQGNWNKVTGIGLILGDTSASESSPEKSQSDYTVPLSPVVQIIEKKEETKVVVTKSWDSDLRKIVGTVDQEGEKSKSKNIKKETGRRKNSPMKTENKDRESERKAKIKAKSKRIENDKKDLSKNDETDEKSNNKNEKNLEENIDCTKTNVNKKITIQETVKITSSVTKSLNEKCNDENKPKNVKTLKISPESTGPVSRLPNILDLETPRKTEVTFYVPPTPRLLETPGDNLKSTRVKQSSEVSIKACVDTPDFPITPSIVFTPKFIEEEEGDSKKESPYYEPEEQTQPPKTKEVVNAEKITVEETTTTLTMKKNVVELQDNKAVEITRYGVVDARVTQEEKEEEKEEEIVSEESSKENIEDENLKENVEEEENIEEESSKENIEEESAADTTNASNNSYTDSDDDSSDSDTSSSSSSSSDTSSSSSSSDSSAASSPEKSSNLKESQDNDNSPELESPETMVNNLSIINHEDLKVDKNIKNENSPEKVFPVLKEILTEDLKETPVKDESNTIPEACISETPSVSDSERALRRDSLTNLTSKISAIITSQSEEPMKNSTNIQNYKSQNTNSLMEPFINKNVHNNAAKPRIISIQRVPAEGMTQQVSKMLQSELQNQLTIQQQEQKAIDNAKLSQQLEEKRLRVMAKFKEADTKPVNTRQRKNVDESKKKVEKATFSTTDNLRSRVKQVQVPEKTQNVKIEKKVEEKVSESCKTKLADKKKEENSKDLKKGKGKATPRKKTVQNDQLIKTENINTKTNCKAVEIETTQNVSKDAPTDVTAIAVENSKGISKAKVDQVKRDLFSDEEKEDQRTTRSQTARRTIDNQKKEDKPNSNILQNNAEVLPGVLECLQLRPANKSESELDEFNLSCYNDEFSDNQKNNLELTFIYDESVPLKKRKRKYSNSELQPELEIKFDDSEDFVHLKVTEYDEIFKMAPKNNKKKCSSPKKSPIKVKKNKDNDNNAKQPLATSSPLKVPKRDESRSDHKKKKSSKRKASPVKEDKQVEVKKSRADPQTLFSQIKVEDFLMKVHVPK